MARHILRELTRLRVQVCHPPDQDGISLVEHLRRIGCGVETQWPIPDRVPETTDMLILAVDYDHRDRVLKLVKSFEGNAPTLVAVVGYENPGTLQIVLESGALAVVECPIRPFGLLTNLTIARSLWLDRNEAKRRAEKLERRLNGIQDIQKAKSILMTLHGHDEAAAYAAIRRQAMATRKPMEDVAVAIIQANELLNSASGHD